MAIPRAASSYSLPKGIPFFDIEISNIFDYGIWEEDWERFLRVTGLESASAQMKVDIMLSGFSNATKGIIKKLDLSFSDRKDEALVREKLRGFIRGSICRVIERRKLRRRTQRPNEDLEIYVMELREIMKNCDFCDVCAETVLCDQVAEGISNQEAVKEMLRDEKLTLKKAIAIGRSHEESSKCKSLLQETETTQSQVNQTHKTHAKNPVKKNPFRKKIPENITCTKCGFQKHFEGRECPAEGQECNKCGRSGHFGSVCRGLKPASSNVAKISSMQTSKAPASKSPHSKPCQMVYMSVTTSNGRANVHALPDTGAEFSGAGLDLLNALGESDHNLVDAELKAEVFNGETIHAIGCLPVHIQIQGGTKVKVMVFIFREVKNFILSWFTTKEIGLLSPYFPLPRALCVVRKGNEQSLLKMSKVSVNPEEIPEENSIRETKIPSDLSSNGEVSSRLQLEQVSQKTIKAFGPILDEYPDVFDGIVKPMKGELYKIHVKPGAIPFAVVHPRTVALPMLPKLRAELDTYLSNELIAPQTKPTDWCHPIVVVPKRGTDKVRVCIDFTKLNAWVKRELFWSNTPLEAVVDIPESSQIFSIFDALKGYHQCGLDPESQDLTTFTTPFGRFKFLRAPYGVNSISEHYNRRMSEAFSGLTFVRKIVDDIAIFSKSPQEHKHNLKTFLDRCRANRISLSLPKVQLAKEEVIFAGFSLSSKGYAISSEITKSLLKFPTPSGVSDVRSFFGLANQVGAFNKSVCEAIEPLRGLLQSRNAWHWDQFQDEAFVQAKKKLAETMRLNFYNVEKPTRLVTDASRIGLGFLLQQEDSDGTWRTVQVGSRMLKDAEMRYAVIELEMLGIQYAVEKCRIFLHGLEHFWIITDHSPLVSICNNHRLDEIENPRLQRLRAKMLGYNFTVKWMAGKMNEAADALSRHPSNPPEDRETADDEVEFDGNVVHACSPAMIRAETSIDPVDPLLQDLKTHSDRCTTYQEIKRQIQDGFPSAKGLLSNAMKPFWKIRRELSVDEQEFVLFGFRLLIPESLRQSILSRLHDAHQGIARAQARARQVVYWPNIDADIETWVSTCKFCQDNLPRQQCEPLIQKERPERPFEELALDLATVHGRDFLIVVDCATDWPDILDLGHDTTSLKLINTVRGIFCRTGAPSVLWSDNGPQLVSIAFEEFLHDWHVIHKVSSPYFPQSNGKAESAVKSMKKLLKSCWKSKTVDQDKLTRALLSYRNTPCQRDGKSPAEKLLGMPLRDNIPAHRSSFKQSHIVASAILDKADRYDNNSKTSFDRHAKKLPSLQVGDLVAIFDPRSDKWSIYGTIVEIAENRRYLIKTPSGAVFCRNRKYLRKRHPLSVPPDAQTRGLDQSHSTPFESLIPQIITHPRPIRTRRKPDRLGYERG